MGAGRHARAERPPTVAPRRAGRLRASAHAAAATHSQQAGRLFSAIDSLHSMSFANSAVVKPTNDFRLDRTHSIP